jgi:2-polyprenyl-3-methyl-5-hydroxy-6-metoxy-1,4-benzoquinol methylase
MKYTPEAPLVKSLKKGSTERHLKMTESKIARLAEFEALLVSGEVALEEVRYGRGELECLAAADRYGLPIGAWIDRQTGIAYTSPRLSQASNDRFYRDYYRSIYTGEAEVIDEFFARQLKQGDALYEKLFGEEGVLKDIAFPDRPKFADVGCGAGGFVKAFAERGWQTTGCDFDERYLDHGKSKGLDLRFGDAEAVAIDGPYDFAVCIHVVEHCRDPWDQFRRLADLLEPTGYLYVEVPGLLTAANQYRHLENYFHVAHTFHFTRATLAMVAAECGLEEVEADESVWAVFHKSEPAEAVDTLPEAQKVIDYFEHVQSGKGKMERWVNKQKRSIEKRLK